MLDEKYSYSHGKRLDLGALSKGCGIGGNFGICASLGQFQGFLFVLASFGAFCINEPIPI
jgi:hypothetical protein